MSWADAKDHMDAYRRARTQALNNVERQKWFMTDADSVASALDLFARDEENSSWEREYNGDGDLQRLQGLRLKIAALCSATRDLRSQFAAGSNSRVRTAVDWDRYEFMRCGFNITKLDHLDQVVGAKEAGIPALT